MRNRERSKTEIGLGLAAARREEQQLGNLTIAMFAIGKPRDVEKNECELEWPPLGCWLGRGVAGRSGIAAASCHRDGEVHEAERSPGSLILRENIDPLDDPLTRFLHF